MSPTPAPRSKPNSGSLGAFLETAIILVIALVLSLIVKTFLVQAFSIPSGSMENTLLVGDRVLVSKLTPGPFDLHRGDVVVFKDPGGWLPAPVRQPNGVPHLVTTALTFIGLMPADAGEHLIKRVIGLPGDTVKCCDTQHRLTVNGVSITEPYLPPGNNPSDEQFQVKVQPNHLWVMGDNRGASLDSRFHRDDGNDGQVPIGNVVGKAFAVVWPFSRLGGVSDPPGVFTAVPATQP